MMAVHAFALNVENTAGNLVNKVNDRNITSLTVTGTINAADLYFIADELYQLTSLDLSAARILPCQLSKKRYFKDDFAGDELPQASLADMRLTSVVLPDGLKVIGKGALAGCTQLTNINLPASLVEIDDYAFAGCTALTRVTIPAAVTTVGTGAFMRCASLTQFQVQSGGSLASLGDKALMDCPALTSIDMGTALQSMGELALAGTGLSELDLTSHHRLDSIGDWAMVLMPLEQVRMPQELRYLGDGALLYDTQLTIIKLGSKLSRVGNYLLAGTAIAGNLLLPSVSTVGDYALYNVSTLSVVELPATLTYLGERAMAGMTGLTSLTSKAVKVPDLGDQVWAGVNQSSIPLTVPRAARYDYQAAYQWQDFIYKDYGLLGDVNGDGEVNIADINTLIDIILNDGQGFDEDTLVRADVNMDGEINVADVNALIDIVLS